MWRGEENDWKIKAKEKRWMNKKGRQKKMRWLMKNKGMEEKRNERIKTLKKNQANGKKDEEKFIIKYILYVRIHFGRLGQIKLNKKKSLLNI